MVWIEFGMAMSMRCMLFYRRKSHYVLYLNNLPHLPCSFDLESELLSPSQPGSVYRQHT